jgi:hypothetical protein
LKWFQSLLLLLLTAIGLTPGGSSTVYIYTQYRGLSTHNNKKKCEPKLIKLCIEENAARNWSNLWQTPNTEIFKIMRPRKCLQKGTGLGPALVAGLPFIWERESKKGKVI